MQTTVEVDSDIIIQFHDDEGSGLVVSLEFNRLN